MSEYYTKIPNEIITYSDISPQARCLWIIMVRHIQEGENKCDVNMDKISECFGRSKKTVKKYRDELEEAGFIKVNRRGQGNTNLYTLYWPKPKEEMNPRYHISYEKTEDCVNPDALIMCLKCNECGRFDCGKEEDEDI